MELPFVDSDHLLAGKVELPQIPPINLGGVEIDMSITRHVVVMWVVSAVLIGLLLSAFRKPTIVPSGIANFFETIAVFLRDEVVDPIMGHLG